ncbi:MAG: PspC domain-containing protein [Prolixibacteraceae bacterium]|jgi:phage shock protein PspC (stress-responsive transcriptional regulator)|nr:PspC domain-containing protein [Prolixibacteraceae bacterium]
MKKTLTINISGTVFHIDEDAYDKLKTYLNKISEHFNKEEGGHEIISDIETRISELFTEKTIDNQNVVNERMVNHIIEVMGLPEDFVEADEESQNKNTQSTQSTGYYRRRKRLYRDPESRILGGVCGGLSHFFRMDKLIVRILFFILFIITSGIALPAYIILWIAVPKARTTSQRLDMRGEDINVENIGKSVKEEFGEMKDSFNKYKDSSEFQKGKEYARKAGHSVSEAGRDTAHVLTKIFGAIFLFIGFISLVGLLLGLLATTQIIGFFPEFLSDANSGLFMDHIFSGTMASTLIISAFVIAGIPLLLIIYAGTKMLFNYTSNSKAIILSSLGLWIIGIILAIATSVGAIDIFSTDASITDSYSIKSTSDTLFITTNNEKFDKYIETRFEVNNVMVMMEGDKEVLVARPQFTIEQTTKETMEIKVRKSSKGNNYRTAKRNANKINYSYKIEGSDLILDPYFLLEENSKWRTQELNLTLKLPEGKIVFLNDKLLPIIYDIENTSNTWDGDMVGEFWEMKSEGLSLSN